MGSLPGVFTLTWHNNFIPDGEKTPAFPEYLQLKLLIARDLNRSKRS